MFRAWLHDEFTQYDADERDDNAWIAKNCTNPRSAATEFAEYCHARRDGWEWSWPIEVIVDDGSQHWLVEVERETVPEFYANRAEKLSTPKATP